MTEMAIVEAVKSAGGAMSAQAAQQAQAAAQVADPSAVARFQEALAPQAVAGVPFASQVAEVWGTAQMNHQGLLHRIRALSELRRLHGPSAAQMTELQYEVMNLSFQQEVVTNIAKKASDAVSTLVKNG